MEPLAASLDPTDAEAAADLATVQALMQAEADPWSRHLPLHLTASALVVHPASGRVLLRWHAKQQRWLQVGGHGDPGESDAWAIALREAREETTLGDLRPYPDSDPLVVDVAVVQVNPTPKEPAHRHADVRYLIATDRPDDVPGEVEDVPLRWCSIDEALAVSDEWLARLVRRAASFL